MTDLPSLHALKVFEVVGRLGSMTKAALELKVSTGAISQQIRLLEKALDLSLLHKGGAGIVLTEIGGEYHDAVSRSFLDLENAHRRIVEQHRRGAIKISALPLFASRWLSNRMLSWQTSHPNVKFQLESTAFEVVSQDASYDFRITYEARRNLFESYVVLFRDSLIPVCSPELAARGHPLAQPADLLSHRLLTIDWRPFLSAAPTWKDWFRLASIDESNVPDSFVMSLSHLAIEAAIAGSGVALAQKALVQGDLDAGRLIAPFDLAFSLPCPYILGWRKNAFAKEGAREFHRWIASEARKQVLADAV